MEGTVSYAIDYAATVMRDPEVMLALASHLTVSELEAIAGIFKADGDLALYDEMMHFMIHGDFEVYGIVESDGDTHLIEYYDGCDRLFFTKQYHGAFSEVCDELMLEVGPSRCGRVVVTSRIAGKV